MINFLRKLFSGNKESTSAFLSETPGKGISLKTGGKLQDQYRKTLEEDDEDRAFNDAARILMDGDFQGSIDAYRAFLEKYPERRASVDAQIGAALYFLQDYDAAIEHYVSAREHGADEDMMDDNIWEACETLHNKTKDLNNIRRYLELCPNGSYVKQAQKLLN